MDRILTYTIKPEQEGMQLLDFLRSKGFSRGILSSMKADKNAIQLNGERGFGKSILQAGDSLHIHIPEADNTENILPVKMDLSILYEDEDILVLNKPPYTVVHPTRGYPTGTLANGVLYYFNETNQNCIVRLVSRLDMDTSGLIIIAKNQYAHMALSKEMQLNHLEKRYLAVVHGHLQKEEGTIDLPIFKPEDEESIFKRIIDERGQRSITHYKVVKKFKDATLVECLLETGRTHQIRVHLSHIGHPIYGDTLYGYGEEEKELIPRQALHAYGLDFKSPRTKEKLSLRAELPEDILNLINKL